MNMNISDNTMKRKLQEDIYKCNQSELNKIVKIILIEQDNKKSSVKYTKNAKGYYFNINTITNEILIEIKNMLENFESQRI